jgi:hypothetical protein
MDLRASKNLLLRELSPDAAERLAPHFHAQPLDFKQTLTVIESGVASLRAGVRLV